MSDTIKKRWVEKNIAEQLEFEASSNIIDYKVESICISSVFTGKSGVDYVLALYYLVSWESYPEDGNT